MVESSQYWYFLLTNPQHCLFLLLDVFKFTFLSSITFLIAFLTVVISSNREASSISQSFKSWWTCQSAPHVPLSQSRCTPWWRRWTGWRGTIWWWSWSCWNELKMKYVVLVNNCTHILKIQDNLSLDNLVTSNPRHQAQYKFSPRSDY